MALSLACYVPFVCRLVGNLLGVDTVGMVEATKLMFVGCGVACPRSSAAHVFHNGTPPSLLVCQQRPPAPFSGEQFARAQELISFFATCTHDMGVPYIQPARALARSHPRVPRLIV